MSVYVGIDVHRKRVGCQKSASGCDLRIRERSGSRA